MGWPWVSRSTFRLVVEAKNEVIAYQREQLRELRDALSRPIAVSVKLPDDFAVIAPAIVRGKNVRRDVKPENSFPSEEIDWHKLDEEDPDAIARIIAKETGGRRIPPQLLAQSVARVKRRIVQAKVNQTLRQMEVGTLDARVSPSVIVSTDNPEENIPEDIRQRIEMADRGQ